MRRSKPHGLIPRRSPTPRASTSRRMVVRCKRLRLRENARRAEAAWLCAGGFARSRRACRAQHLPHPREGDGEGFLRTRPVACDIKEDRPAACMRVAVAGCVAQAEGEEIMRREPSVDMVVGPQSYHRLPEMIARLSRKTGDVLETDFAAEEKFDALPKTREVSRVRPPSSQCRKVATSSARSASCPTRAAPNIRAAR